MSLGNYSTIGEVYIPGVLVPVKQNQIGRRDLKVAITI